MIYLLIFKRRCAEKIKNPGRYFFDLMDLWLYIFFFWLLYGFAMEGRENLAGMTFPCLATYVTMGYVWFDITRINGTKLANKVYKNKFLFEFLKPYSYRGKVFSEAAADLLAGLVIRFLPTLLVLFLTGNLVPPISGMGALLFAASLLLGTVLWWNMDFLLQLIGFWYMTMYSVFYVAYAVYEVFAGVLLPYAFLPDCLTAVLKCTPLYYTFAFPMDIYFGKLSAGQIAGGFLLQMLFTVLLIFLGKVVFERGKHRLQTAD